MSEKTIHIEGIGNVRFRKNIRSKNVSIALRPQKGVMVTLPSFVSYGYALKVVEQKRPWIKKHWPKIQAIEDKATVFTENTSFKTRARLLKITQNCNNHIKTKLTPNSIEIEYPEKLNIKSPEIQHIIKQTIIKALRYEAKEYLPERVKILAQKYRFNYQKIYIKNNKTLWGSCSGVNNINFNLHLMRLPDHLIDYVIIHELCHTIEKNHGLAFWNLMDSILGNARSLSKELKKYSINIY
ncbi:MAG: SprT family zinc-dependent metalloprotease [Bacteroidales bacterium]